MKEPEMPREYLEAASRIVATEGVEALTMARLAQALGLSRATVYRQTGGRELLLDALAASGRDVGDRTEARERVLRGAREVFGREGFEGATIEQVAAAARVGPATIYRHFGDKEGLVRAFLDELPPRRAMREARAEMSGELRADLERVVERLLSAMQQDEPLVRLMLLETLRESALLPRVRALSPVSTLGQLTSLLREHVEAGRLRARFDPRLLAQALSGMILAFGVIAPLLRREPAVDPVKTARDLVDLFLGGALAERGAARG